jgi:ApaG protein
MTRGFRVSVSPAFVPHESDRGASQFVFGYRVTIRNESGQSARLVSRRWLITDGQGRQRLVEGEGVLGKQPLIPPGHAHVYSSHCPLKTPWGTMEGVYAMQGEDGEQFEIQVGKFFLIAPDDE